MSPFAFAVTDALSGGAGWVGAGLLSAILSWLCLVHIPANHKLILALIEQFSQALARKDAQIDEQRKQLLEMLTEQRAYVAAFLKELAADLHRGAS